MVELEQIMNIPFAHYNIYSNIFHLMLYVKLNKEI